VVSEVKQTAESEFLFEAGIEKRNIKLSPEKTREMIKNLNESIEKWENIVSKLGNVVKGLKAACFATWAVLVAKNFFSNLEGGATARQAIMPRWYEECQKQSANDKVMFNKCLSDSESLIKQDIVAYEQGTKNVNDNILALENNKAYQLSSGAVDRKKVTAKFLEDEFKEDYSYTAYAPNDDPNIGHTATISSEALSKASLVDLRDLKLYQNILSNEKSSDDVLKRDVNIKIGEIAQRLGARTKPVDTSGEPTDNNWFSIVPPVYFSTGKVQQISLPDKKYGSKTGFYVILEESDYTSGGDIKQFTIKKAYTNVPTENDIPNKVLFERYGNQYLTGDIPIFGLEKDESAQLIKDALAAIDIARRNYGKDKFVLFGRELIVKKSGAVNEKRCQDFMSPTDCNILFNVCDPVICPSSRCDLGGTYRVDNVIQSGIIGSLVLCLPNKVAVPVCLSGVQAGLDAYVTILRNHRDCLQEKLKTGKNVGICDEAY
ncbi:MAG: hypothetical protein AABX65_03235, partial [Nanoarchaeota archaeon]